MNSRDLKPAQNLDIAKQAAHDIRAPLTALQFLVNEMNGGSAHEELLKTIIGRINNIANDLLHAGRNRASSLAVTKAVTKAVLAKTIDRLCQEKELQLRRQGVALCIQWNCREDFEIQTDLGELTRVLSNLINNAVEAGASRVTVKVSVQKGSIRFAVVDNGVGFENKSPKKATSHGLGLNGAAKFLNLHKTRLRVARVAGLTRVGFGIAVN